MNPNERNESRNRYRAHAQSFPSTDSPGLYLPQHRAMGWQTAPMPSPAPVFSPAAGQEQTGLIPQNILDQGGAVLQAYILGQRQGLNSQGYHGYMGTQQQAIYAEHSSYGQVGLGMSQPPQQNLSMSQPQQFVGMSHQYQQPQQFYAYGQQQLSYAQQQLAFQPFQQEYHDPNQPIIQSPTIEQQRDLGFGLMRPRGSQSSYKDEQQNPAVSQPGSGQGGSRPLSHVSTVSRSDQSRPVSSGGPSHTVADTVEQPEVIEQQEQEQSTEPMDIQQEQRNIPAEEPSTVGQENVQNPPRRIRPARLGEIFEGPDGPQHCAECNEPNHFAGQCRQGEVDNVNYNPIVCDLCGYINHYKRDCCWRQFDRQERAKVPDPIQVQLPRDPAEIRGQIFEAPHGPQYCLNCGEPNHVTKHCRKGYLDKRTGEPYKCILCGFLNHLNRECSWRQARQQAVPPQNQPTNEPPADENPSGDQENRPADFSNKGFGIPPKVDTNQKKKPDNEEKDFKFKCYNCGKKGHRIGDCPEPPTEQREPKPIPPKQPKPPTNTALENQPPRGRGGRGSTVSSSMSRGGVINQDNLRTLGMSHGMDINREGNGVGRFAGTGGGTVGRGGSHFAASTPVQGFKRPIYKTVPAIDPGQEFSRSTVPVSRDTVPRNTQFGVSQPNQQFQRSVGPIQRTGWMNQMLAPPAEVSSFEGNWRGASWTSSRYRGRSDLRPSLNQRPARQQSPVVCIQCQQPNHYAYRCRYEVRDQNGNPVVCEECGYPNHLQRDCTALRDRQRNQQQQPPRQFQRTVSPIRISRNQPIHVIQKQKPTQPIQIQPSQETQNQSVQLIQKPKQSVPNKKLFPTHGNQQQSSVQPVRKEKQFGPVQPIQHKDNSAMEVDQPAEEGAPSVSIPPKHVQTTAVREDESFQVGRLSTGSTDKPKIKKLKEEEGYVLRPGLMSGKLDQGRALPISAQIVKIDYPNELNEPTMYTICWATWDCAIGILCKPPLPGDKMGPPLLVRFGDSTSVDKPDRVKMHRSQKVEVYEVQRLGDLITGEPIPELYVDSKVEDWFYANTEEVQYNTIFPAYLATEYRPLPINSTCNVLDQVAFITKAIRIRPDGKKAQGSVVSMNIPWETQVADYLISHEFGAYIGPKKRTKEGEPRMFIKALKRLLRVCPSEDDQLLIGVKDAIVKYSSSLDPFARKKLQEYILSFKHVRKVMEWQQKAILPTVDLDPYDPDLISNVERDERNKFPVDDEIDHSDSSGDEYIFEETESKDKEGKTVYNMNPQRVFKSKSVYFTGRTWEEGERLSRKEMIRMIENDQMVDEEQREFALRHWRDGELVTFCFAAAGTGKTRTLGRFVYYIRFAKVKFLAICEATNNFAAGNIVESLEKSWGEVFKNEKKDFEILLLRSQAEESKTDFSENPERVYWHNKFTLVAHLKFLLSLPPSKSSSGLTENIQMRIRAFLQLKQMDNQIFSSEADMVSYVLRFNPNLRCVVGTVEMIRSINRLDLAQYYLIDEAGQVPGIDVMQLLSPTRCKFLGGYGDIKQLAPWQPFRVNQLESGLLGFGRMSILDVGNKRFNYFAAQIQSKTLKKNKWFSIIELLNNYRAHPIMVDWYAPPLYFPTKIVAKAPAKERDLLTRIKFPMPRRVPFEGEMTAVPVALCHALGKHGKSTTRSCYNLAHENFSVRLFVLVMEFLKKHKLHEKPNHTFNCNYEGAATNLDRTFREEKAKVPAGTWNKWSRVCAVTNVAFQGKESTICYMQTSRTEAVGYVPQNRDDDDFDEFAGEELTDEEIEFVLNPRLTTTGITRPREGLFAVGNMKYLNHLEASCWSKLIAEAGPKNVPIIDFYSYVEYIERKGINFDFWDLSYNKDGFLIDVDTGKSFIVNIEENDYVRSNYSIIEVTLCEESNPPRFRQDMGVNEPLDLPRIDFTQGIDDQLENVQIDVLSEHGDDQIDTISVGEELEEVPENEEVMEQQQDVLSEHSNAEQEQEVIQLDSSEDHENMEVREHQGNGVGGSGFSSSEGRTSPEDDKNKEQKEFKESEWD